MILTGGISNWEQTDRDITVSNYYIWLDSLEEVDGIALALDLSGGGGKKVPGWVIIRDVDPARKVNVSAGCLSSKLQLEMELELLQCWTRRQQPLQLANG